MKMKKFINKPQNIAREMLQGYIAAYGELVQFNTEDIIIRAQPKEKGKVHIVLGQGAGHEPGYSGLLGYGIHDVEVLGGIFSCAGGDRIYEGIRHAWQASGNHPVLVLIANHEGDVINNSIALEMARDDGIDVESIILYDDIARAPREQKEERRGLAAAMKPCMNPTSGQTLFTLENDELLIGPGAHGEAGPEGAYKLIPADEIMTIVAERVLKDGGFNQGDSVLVLLNGSGATTLMELFILYNRLNAILEDKGIHPYKPLIGNYVTTQEMAGFSLSLCHADEKIMELWAAPANTPFFKVV